MIEGVNLAEVMHSATLIGSGQFVPKIKVIGIGSCATHIDHALSMKYLTGEQHCYSYRQLYDQCSLDWRDLLRIGNLYVELKIDEQSGMLTLGQQLFNGVQ